jgi:HK97 family phage major capsid protein
MPHALVEDYIRERDDLVNTVNVLKNNAADRGKDPTADDLEMMTKSYARIDRLDEMIAVLGRDTTMDQETRDKLLSPTPGPPSEVMYRSGGEMLWDCLHGTFGSSHDHDDQDAKRRWDLVMKRAAEHMGTKASNTTPVAGDVGGLFVAPIVGPVIDLSPKGQPFLSAIGRQQAPNALTFSRPRIVDPNLKTGGAAQQTLEKAELVSKKFDIKVDNLSLNTYGGYLNVSQQLMSLQPAGWNIIISQLQRRVAWQGEAAALTALALTTAKVTLAAGATAAVTIKALYDAAALVYTNTSELPTWITYGPAGWAMLGSLVDSAGRPLFPYLGAANAIGTASLDSFNLGPLGLQSILTPAITDTKIYVGNSSALEAYVYPFPVLEAVEPALLGRQVAVAEAIAFYRPVTNETGPVSNGAVLVGP